MIENHFQFVRSELAKSEWLTNRIIVESEYDQDCDIGIIGGSLTFKDGSVFHFREVLIGGARKYRFHYMDSESNLIIRWDNAPHHQNLSTFPHHVHLPDRVESCEEIGFVEALHKTEAMVIKRLEESL